MTLTVLQLLEKPLPVLSLTPPAPCSALKESKALILPFHVKNLLVENTRETH